MKRSSLLLAVRGLHYALVQIASLGLGAFFWFTLMTMVWRTLPPATGDANASSALAAAAPYLAAVAVHAATLWYVGGSAYVAQARTVIAVLAGSLLTYLAMSLFQAQYAMLGAYLATPYLKAVGTTGLFFAPGWALVQWLRPAPARDPAREAIKVPITIACYLGAAACAVAFAMSNSPAIAVAALVLVLGLVFLAVHWVYHGRLGFDADASRHKIRGQILAIPRRARYIAPHTHFKPPVAEGAGLPLTDLDLSPHAAGNTGISFVHSFDGQQPGPHAMIVALVHGNETCGAIALDYLLRKSIRPSRGKLTLCFANIDAFARYDQDNPGAARFVDEDMNRLWDAATLGGPSDSIELRRARALAPVVATADFLLDLHSMQLRGSPLILAGAHPKGRALARRIGLGAPVIVDHGHSAGTRLRDFAGFADGHDPRTALLVECGQHRDDESVTVALYCALRFIQAAGVVAAEAIAPPTSPHRRRPRAQT